MAWLNWFWRLIGTKAVEPIKKGTQMSITGEQLKKICTQISQSRCNDMADLINRLTMKYGITEKKPFQMFLANVVQESGEFTHKTENMNYSAARILQVWPTRFRDLAHAKEYERNPEKLANYVYGGRMGNTDPGDGWRYRGMGFIGLTGKEVCTAYAKHLGKDVSLTADLVRSQDLYAMDSACWFFADLKKLIPVANTKTFRDVIRGINGGLIGLATRQVYYDRVKSILN